MITVIPGRGKAAAEGRRCRIIHRVRQEHEIGVGVVERHVLREGAPVRESRLELGRADLLIAGAAYSAVAAARQEGNGDPVTDPEAPHAGACGNDPAGQLMARPGTCCFQPPGSAGETPISDTRLVLSGMRSSTREMFERKGILYVRNYRPNAGVSWQQAFATEDRSRVEQICAASHIECEWRSGGVLRTRQYGSAIVCHPKTGQSVWFNHAFFFNIRAIEPASLREAFLKDPPDDPLSTNTLFGDGSPIGADIIEELRSLYGRASVSHPWEHGDLLLIDNMLSAHARAAFKGKRKIVVVMADSFSRPSSGPPASPR